MDGSRYRVTTADEAARAVADLLDEARREVDLLSPELDPALYDRSEVVDAVRRVVATAGRRARIRVLLRDAASVGRRGHRLAALAQRLTTGLEIRRLAGEDAELDAAMVVVDGRGLARWTSTDDYAGIIEPDAPGVAQREQRWFTELWERGEPEPEFRRLSL